MKGNSYLERVSAKLDCLSDEDFLNLLVEAGIDECPYEITFNVNARFGKKVKYEMNVEPVIVPERLVA